MSDIERLRKLADGHWYGTADSLIDACMAKVTSTDHAETAYRAIRDVFAGLAEADVRGLISTGDEHEWAAVALRANERMTTAPKNAEVPYLRMEDNYDEELALDTKHCTETELRLMVNGSPFYLTPKTAAELVKAVTPLAADWRGK